MKPITEFFFAENQITSDESWFWFSELKQESFVMYSEEEFRENIVVSSISSTLYGEFLFQRSSYTFNTSRDYEKIDSILSYMGGFIQMVLVTAQLGMEFYNTQNLKLKLANQLYQFEELKELTEQDKDIKQFKSKQDFLENVFQKISKKPKELSLNLSYFFFRFSFKKLFKTPQNQLLYEALKQVDNDLNMFEILVRLQEADKMKQIIFTEDQRKVLEFSDKPLISLETIYKNKVIKEIQKKENKRKKKKELAEKRMKQVKKKGIFKLLLRKIKSKKENLKSDLTNKVNLQSDIKTPTNKFTFSMKKVQSLNLFDLAALSAFFSSENNWERTKTISRLLIEEQFVRNKMMIKNSDQYKTCSSPKQFLHQQSIISKNNSNSLASIPCQNCQNQIFDQSSQNNTQIQQQYYQQHQAYQKGEQDNSPSPAKKANKDHEQEELTPLEQFIHQNKSKNNQGMILNLIKELAPSTFYCERTDYSKFSSFYELYEVCEESILKPKNKSNKKQNFLPLYLFQLFQIWRLTKKIIENLREDIRDAFRLAKQLPSKEDLKKKKKIEELVATFICQIKEKRNQMQRKSIDYKAPEEKEKGNTLQQQLNSKYYFQKYNTLNKKNENNQHLIQLMDQPESMNSKSSRNLDSQNLTSLANPDTQSEFVDLSNQKTNFKASSPSIESHLQKQINPKDSGIKFVTHSFGGTYFMDASKTVEPLCSNESKDLKISLRSCAPKPNTLPPFLNSKKYDQQLPPRGKRKTYASQASKFGSNPNKKIQEDLLIIQESQQFGGIVDQTAEQIDISKIKRETEDFENSDTSPLSLLSNLGTQRFPVWKNKTFSS